MQKSNDAARIAELKYTVELCEKAEKYEDMANCMKEIIEIRDGVLMEEERNMFSVAYKYIVYKRRKAWREMCIVEDQNEELKEEFEKEEEKEKEIEREKREREKEEKKLRREKEKREREEKERERERKRNDGNSSGNSDNNEDDNEEKEKEKERERKEKETKERKEQERNVEKVELSMRLLRSTQFRLRLEGELKDVCEEVLTLLNEQILPKLSIDLANAFPVMVNVLSKTKDRVEVVLKNEMAKLQEKVRIFSKVDGQEESLVFALKMMGDYYRFTSEFRENIALVHKINVLQALAAYYIGTEIASVYLTPTHPLRLSLALNFSVFYYDIMAQPEYACQLAKNAFNEAIAEIDQGEFDKELYTYKDTTTVMQMLRDNLTRWTQE